MPLPRDFTYTNSTETFSFVETWPRRSDGLLYDKDRWGRKIRTYNSRFKWKKT